MTTEMEHIEALAEALETIAGGYRDRFPGAPDAMNWDGSPEEFRSQMWSWSQRVAKAAIEEHKAWLKIHEEEQKEREIANSQFGVGA